MTTQALTKLDYSAVLDDCSSWIERILVHTAERIAAGRSRRVQRQQLRRLGKLSTLQLEDIGLVDPQLQRRLFGAYIQGTGEDLENLRNRLQVSR